ncbi:MAG: hypothetical protein ACPGN3_02500 [Opitutales bacterium]
MNLRQPFNVRDFLGWSNIFFGMFVVLGLFLLTIYHYQYAEGKADGDWIAIKGESYAWAPAVLNLSKTKMMEDYGKQFVSKHDFEYELKSHANGYSVTVYPVSYDDGKPIRLANMDRILFFDLGINYVGAFGDRGENSAGVASVIGGNV